LENDRFAGRNAEGVMRDLKDRFRGIFDDLRDGLLLADKETLNFIVGNRAIREMLGYGEEELSQLGIEDIHPREALSWVISQFEALAKGEIAIASDIPVKRKDGSVFYVDISSSYPMTFNGKDCLMGVFRDTTDHRRMEKALRESESKFRKFFEDDLTGDYITSADGIILDCNQAFLQIFGYKNKMQAVGENFVVLFSDPSERELILHQLRTKGKLENYETIRKRRDGSLITVNENIVATFDEERKLVEVKGYVYDITERKQAEEALRESEAKYRRIVDTANEGIWSVDENFITTFVNRGMAWMLGYNESEMIGRPVHWFMFEEDLANLREKMRDRQTGISDRYERRYRHKDGRPVWVILSVTPLVDDKDGSFKGSFAMVTDISDRKQMEEELFKSRHELELRVRERTADLERANDQLQSIPSKLIAAQEDERRRIAGELHDSVGQTLAAIKYGIETVLVNRDRGDLVGAFNLLERFVPTLQRSIDETRGIYMGLRPPMLDSLGLLATLEWFCREFQSLHSSFRLELETKIKEEEIPDTMKIIIFRIVQEALNNAAKHSRAKRVSLLLAKIRSSIELTVEDDGEGFELDSVLSHNDLKSLGLTGMSDRAKLGGGIFSIESTPGRGTVVRVSWPT
jgi:PAS domain S-box-containing protein